MLVMVVGGGVGVVIGIGGLHIGKVLSYIYKTNIKKEQTCPSQSRILVFECYYMIKNIISVQFCS